MDRERDRHAQLTDLAHHLPWSPGELCVYDRISRRHPDRCPLDLVAERRTPARIEARDRYWREMNERALRNPLI